MKLMAVFLPQPDECWDSSDEIMYCYCDLIQSKLEKVKKLCHSVSQPLGALGPQPLEAFVSQPLGALGSQPLGALVSQSRGNTQVMVPGSIWGR